MQDGQILYNTQLIQILLILHNIMLEPQFIFFKGEKVVPQT